MENKNNYISEILKTIFVFILFINTGYSNHIIVDPSHGNDTTGNGSLTSPYRSLDRASYSAFGGDSVLIRGGHHYAFRNIFVRHNNQNSQKIYIMPYNKENVILDGQGYQFERFWDAILTINKSNFVEIRDLVVINNDSGPGIRVISDSNWTFPGEIYITRFVNVVNCKTNNTSRQGILIQGKNINVDSCEISNAVMSNAGVISNGGWAAALSTYPYPLSIGRCDSVNFRNNYIHNCWGEGIAQIRGNKYLIEKNKIEDCFSAYIYSDNCKNGIIRNNWMMSTSDEYNRHFENNYTQPAAGIFWAAENNGYGLNEIVDSIEIYNNLIIRTGPAFGWFDDSANTHANDSYKNIKIYHNTVFDTRCIETFYLDPNFASNRVKPAGCKFINNIICKARYLPFTPQYQKYFTNSTDFIDTSNIWEIKNNCFINGDIPSRISSGNISGAPSFLDSNNASSSVNYKLSSFSNSIGSGLSGTGIIKDYWGTTRLSSPTIGFYEWTGQDKNLQLTFFIQGFYNSSTDSLIKDSLRIFLRNYTSPFAIVDSAKGVINSSGRETFSFSNAVNGINYFIAVKHRNSLETWSKTSQSFYSSYMNYDFSTQVTQAYGNNLVQIDTSPVRFGNYSGDVNQNGVIDLTDIIQIYNDASGFKTGYRSTDTNGDNSISLTDVLISYNNSVGFRSVIRP